MIMQSVSEIVVSIKLFDICLLCFISHICTSWHSKSFLCLAKFYAMSTVEDFSYGFKLKSWSLGYVVWFNLYRNTLFTSLYGTHKSFAPGNILRSYSSLVYGSIRPTSGVTPSFFTFYAMRGSFGPGNMQKSRASLLGIRVHETHNGILLVLPKK